MRPGRGRRPSSAAAREAGRTLLTEVESKAVLAAYGIPITETRIAPTADEAVAAAGARSAIRSCSSSSATPSPTRPTSAASSSTWPMQAAVRAAYEAIRAGVTTARGAEHFEGVTVQPMINFAGYELIVGLIDRPAVRAGAAVRHGRPAGRAVPRPGPRAAAAQHHAGAAPDRADQDLRRAEGRPRPPAHRPRRARAAAGPLQPARRRAALDQGDRHQPAAGLAGAADRARRARRPARHDRRRGRPAAPRDPALPAPVRAAVDGSRRPRRSSSGRSGRRTSRPWCSSTPSSPRRPSTRATSSTWASPSAPRTNA